MKQIYEDLSDDTDFDIIDLDDVPDRDTVKRRKKKSQRDVDKTSKSADVKKEEPSSTEDPSENPRKERSEKARKRTSGNSGNGSSKASGNRTGKNSSKNSQNRTGKKKGSQNRNKKNADSDSQKSSRKKRSAPSASIITTPVKKTVQTGAKLTSKLLQTGARGVTLLMIAAIAFIIFKNFWSNYPTYGSLATAVNAKNYTLGAFLGVAAFLLIMEIIFFLWALTGPCAYGDRGTKRVDTGRGLFSFLFIGVTVVAAGMFWSLVPSSPSPLTGLASGLQLYGSLKGILLPLCGVGLVSCIVRKIFS